MSIEHLTYTGDGQKPANVLRAIFSHEFGTNESGAYQELVPGFYCCLPGELQDLAQRKTYQKPTAE